MVRAIQGLRLFGKFYLIEQSRRLPRLQVRMCRRSVLEPRGISHSVASRLPPYRLRFHGGKSDVRSDLFRLLYTMIYNEPRTTLAGYKHPKPLDKHADPKGGLREEPEVYRYPGEPCYGTAGPDLTALQNRKPLANHGHIASIKITKRPRRGSTSDTLMDNSACIASLLDRNLSDAGQRRSILLQQGRVAHHEHFRMLRHGQIIQYLDPSSAIRLHPQPLSGRRWGYTRSPDHRLARDPIARHNDAILIDLIDGLAQPHLYTQPLEPPLRGVRELFGK